MTDVKEFLNPKATLTPGIAGSLAMVAANGMWVGFGLPQAWTALVVSVLCAILLAAGAAAPIWQRVIYVVLNALVIFSVGLGTNGLGSRATAVRTGSVFEIQQFVSVLGAAEAQTQKPPPTAEEVKQLEAELDRKAAELERKAAEVRRLEEALRKSEVQKPPSQAQTPEGGQRKFFERWKF